MISCDDSITTTRGPSLMTLLIALRVGTLVLDLVPMPHALVISLSPGDALDVESLTPLESSRTQNFLIEVLMWTLICVTKSSSMSSGVSTMTLMMALESSFKTAWLNPSKSGMNSPEKAVPCWTLLMDRYAVEVSLIPSCPPAKHGKRKSRVWHALIRSGSASVANGASWIGMFAHGALPSLKTLVLSTLGNLPLLACNLLLSARLEAVDLRPLLGHDWTDTLLTESCDPLGCLCLGMLGII